MASFVEVFFSECEYDVIAMNVYDDEYKEVVRV